MTPSPSSVAPVVAEDVKALEAALAAKPTPAWFIRTNRHVSTDGRPWGWLDGAPSGGPQHPIPGVQVTWTRGDRSEANADYIAAAYPDRIRRILAALASAQGDGSMETAPKGQDVLLYSERNREWFIGDWGRYDIYNHPRISRWRPLPPIPATSPAKD